MKIKLIRMITFTLLATLMLSTVIFATDTLKGGFPATDVKPLKYRYTTNDTYGTKFIVAGAKYWNSISSKVSVSSVTSGEVVTVYATTTTQDGLLGLVVPYYKNIFGNIVEDTSATKKWVSCSLNGYYNQMQNLNMTDSQIISNFAHEFGHTLGLAHPSSSVKALMKMGVQSIKPQTNDKDSLKAKWGD